MTEIKDIFNGEWISAWKDGDFIYISFPFVTINIPADNWNAVKIDFKKLLEIEDKKLSIPHLSGEVAS